VATMLCPELKMWRASVFPRPFEQPVTGLSSDLKSNKKGVMDTNQAKRHFHLDMVVVP